MGTGISGPQNAAIANPVNQKQIDEQYANAKTALEYQQGFVNALGGQGGIQNQANVYNQMANVAAGKGPNPAMAQLQQTTGQNISAQNALMAGQRGSNANVGLMARQAAMQGANLQQQAVGQGASMQAQQSLQALQNMGNLATNQVGQQANAMGAFSNAAQGEQGSLLNAATGFNNAQVGSQNSVNAANAALIQSTQKTGAALLGGAGAGMALGAEGGAVSDMPKYADGGGIDVLPSNSPSAAPSNGPQSRVGQIFANFNTNMSPDQGGKDPNQQLGQMIGKGIKAGYKYLTKPAAPGEATVGQGLQTDPLGVGSLDPNAAGAPMPGGVDPLGVGTLPGADAAGAVDVGANSLGGVDMAADLGAAAEGGSDLAGLAALLAKGGKIEDRQHYDGGGGILKGVMSLLPLLAAAEGGKVPALVSPGEVYLDRGAVEKVAKGADPIKSGEKIPGDAKVKGDKNSYANDTVPKTLEEGGIILPRSVTQSKNPHWAAHKFVSQLMAKNGGKIK